MAKIQYDNFTPEVPYDNPDLPEVLPPSVSNKDKRTGKNSHERKVKRSPQKSNKKVANSTPQLSLVDKLKQWANGTTLHIILGVFLGCLGVYLLICFLSYVTNCVNDQSIINSAGIGMAKGVHNTGGEGGARLSEFLINESFGLGSAVIIVWLMAMSVKLLAGKPRFKSVNFTIKCIVALITVSLIVGLLTLATESTVNWGGYHGRYVNEFIINFTGWIGGALLCLFMIVVFCAISLRDVYIWWKNVRDAAAERKRKQREEEEKRLAKERSQEEMRRREEEDAIKSGESIGDEIIDEPSHDTVVEFGEDSKDYLSSLPELEDIEEEKSSENPNVDEDKPSVVEDKTDTTESPIGNSEEISEDKMVVNVNEPALIDKKAPQKATGGINSVPYYFPSFDLLNPGNSQVALNPEEQLENKEKIRKVLADYGIPIVSIEATVGPTVTLYEIVPDRGVRSANIRRLTDDIALNLAASGVRIIAPIPGKGTVGIEVANKNPQVVSMQTVIKSKKFQETNYKLPIALGCTINNEVYIGDLTKMPHLLVAGATGQGKSVGLNVILTSLLYKKTPKELKFVLIDPKMVEFSIYNLIESHYLAKIPEAPGAIITDMDLVVPTLSSLCVEMDRRYEKLQEARVRKVEEYNAKIFANELLPEDGHEFLPYIVMIADEFADMLMTSGKEVEAPICRLAAKARAVGIHLILATQRPSADIITGKIKANCPARIAFKVSSSVDSKTILDTTGAQQLIGMGDMLIVNNSDMVRVQCAFVDTPEVEKICSYISRQPYNIGPMLLPDPVVTGKQKREGGNSGGYGEIDNLFEEVARDVVSDNSASTSHIQRAYRIGYNRAGNIMDQLEKYGIVGPQNGSKPRSVLVDHNALETILQNLRN